MSKEFPCKQSPPLALPKPPARATEAFLSTIAQGIWAEEKLMEALNATQQFIAIKYGQSRYNHDLISSKDAWKNYIRRLYAQMSNYGKRPDVLVFRRDETTVNLPKDISEEDEIKVKDIVFRSILGIECRSSSYYYNNYIKARGKDIKVLSITVKDEDIDRLKKWRDTYCGKPIYYVQLFFDVGFYISFDKILKIIESAKKGIETKYYRFAKDRKTGKETHFVGVSHAKIGLIAMETPNVTSKSIKAWDGKVYAIRMPEGGKFVLTNEFVQELASLLQPT
jgi:hypothetical protein